MAELGSGERKPPGIWYPTRPTCFSVREGASRGCVTWYHAGVEEGMQSMREEFPGRLQFALGRLSVAACGHLWVGVG